MAGILTLLGFMGVIVSLVILLVNVIRKKSNKKVSKIFWICFVVMVISFIMVPTSDDKEVAENGAEVMPKDAEISQEDDSEKEPEIPKTEDVVKKEEGVRRRSPELSTDELKYTEDLGDQALQWADTLKGIGEVFTEPNPNDEEWILKAAVYLGTMQYLSEEAEKLEAPEKFKEIHSLYLEGVEDLKWVAHNLPKGIDNLDIDIINECTERMQRAMGPIGETTEKLIEISKDTQ